MHRIVVIFVAAVVFASLLVGSAPAAAAKVQKVTVTLNEFKFVPKTVTLRAGIPVELTLVNRGKVEHEFLVYTAPKAAPDDWDEYAIVNTYFKGTEEIEVVFRRQGAVAGTSLFEVEVEAGRSATIEFTPMQKGTFEIGCHVEGHYEAGMKGTLTVR